MEREKLYKILEFNKTHGREITVAKSIFYDCIGRQAPVVISDMQTLAQMIFDSRGYKFLRIPMKSKEIGAFQFRLNHMSYLILNTSKSLVNNNFAIAHELYHILTQNPAIPGNVGELYMNHYEDRDEEYMANAFAGGIIMPEEDFRSIVALLTGTKKRLIEEIKQEEPHLHELLMVFALMSYYKTTYMSVVIRCYELGIFDIDDFVLMDMLLSNNSEDEQRELFKKLPMRKGNISIMEPTYEDDFLRIYAEAWKLGRKNVERGILTEEDFEYRLKGMETAYRYVKGEIE